MKPLNGVKTHPLKAHTIGILKQLAEGPVYAYRINPGVRDRLTREDLARPSVLSSEVKYFITEAGRALLVEIEGGLR